MKLNKHVYFEGRRSIRISFYTLWKRNEDRGPQRMLVEQPNSSCVIVEFAHMFYFHTFLHFSEKETHKHKLGGAATTTPGNMFAYLKLGWDETLRSTMHCYSESSVTTSVVYAYFCVIFRKGDPQT